MLPLREFKLLVREYFQADTVIEKSLILDERLSAGHRKRDLRNRIDKELSRFTAQELAELPFQDTPKYGGLKYSTPEQLNPKL